MFQTIDLSLLRTCAFNRWSPTIGDPTIWGWGTVAAYALCALLALRVVLRSRGGSRRAQLFWGVICIAMAFLALNKQLDLQSLLTATGRCIAHQQGWYEDRRGVQRGVIMALLAVILLLLATSLYLMRRDLRRNALALLGLIVVSGFVAFRAVGFHHFDEIINLRVGDVRFNVIFELTGLVMIALNALVLLLRKGPRRR
ncbi:isopropylmalate isomerase [Pseudorhodobacter sp. MZDSW-24AT]|uniref:isopropylmalate isomerase n=1 Tax=Pseudorhodobacter sp. MZDSW-24AT TaxID=2052957 RepID=UPI000C1F3120|nr:isopropylmalate isomerase [Pseudorhodobacter sp. MZDSW-24AT]PJF09640.1 isopropylmalate isomerase [Pseudorhodobacter sp. MZDSW-24AT]